MSRMSVYNIVELGPLCFRDGKEVVSVTKKNSLTASVFMDNNAYLGLLDCRDGPDF